MNALIRVGAVVFAGLAVFATASLQAATSSSFQISATVRAGCLINGYVPAGDSGSLGKIVFDSRPAIGGGVVDNSLLWNQAIRLQCTQGVALSMKVDGGLGYAGERRMTNALTGATVPYSLFSDDARSQAIPVDQTVSLDISRLGYDNIVLPLYGRVQLPEVARDGSYRDTLRITLEW